MMVFYTASPEQTRAWGEALAGLMEPGDFLALTGSLGAGKTCLVQGLVQGVGAPQAATSPTFGLIHEYRGGRLPVYHFDVYRLDRPEELESLGYEDYFYGDGLCVVEWGELAGPYLPDGRADIVLTPAAAAGERRIQVSLRGKTAAETARRDRLAKALAGPLFEPFRRIKREKETGDADFGH
jgi:tRNA threonylcarbamoyladenosine biosynthesis protein TsaE